MLIRKLQPNALDDTAQNEGGDTEEEEKKNDVIPPKRDPLLRPPRLNIKPSFKVRKSPMAPK